MKAKNYLGLAFAFCMLGGFVLYTRYVNDALVMEDDVSAWSQIWRGVVAELTGGDIQEAQHEAYLASRLDDAREGLSDLKDALRDRDYHAAGNAFYVVSSVDRLQSESDREIDAAFEELLTDVAEQREPFERAEEFVDELDDTRRRLKARLDQFHRTQSEGNVRAARSWVRVKMESGAFSDVVREGLEEQFEHDMFHLVFEPALSDAEEDATRKVLHVEARTETETYWEDGRRDLPSRHLPVGVRLLFQMTGDAELATSWDALTSIHVRVEAPDEVTLVYGDADAKDDRSRLVEELVELLADELDELPAFDLR